MKGVLGAKWVYTLELRPADGSPEANRDDGYGGFALPKEQIVPTGEEIFEVRPFRLGLASIGKALAFRECGFSRSGSVAANEAKLCRWYHAADVQSHLTYRFIRQAR